MAKRSWKEKYQAAKKGRIGRGVRAGGRGLKANGLQVVAGAATQLIEMQLAKHFPQMAAGAWYVSPLAMGALGLLAKRSRRFAGMGDAMLGAAGYAGALRYQLSTASSSGEAGRLVGVPFRPRPRLVAPPVEIPAETGRARGVRSL